MNGQVEASSFLARFGGGMTKPTLNTNTIKIIVKGSSGYIDRVASGAKE